MDFHGFTPQAAEFLWELRFNNERPWFNAHKEEFLNLVDRPFRALGSAVLERMEAAYPRRDWFLHVSRIYRDARRLYGRGPYKDHLWFTLRCDAAKDENAPAFYFEISPEGYSFGMGYYTSGAQFMERYRRFALANPAPLEKLARRLKRQDTFVLTGQDYARKKAQHSPLLDPWLNKRWVTLDCERGFDETSASPALIEDVFEGFSFLLPYYDYFDQLRHLTD